MKPLTVAVPGALRLLLRNAPLSDGKVAFAWRVAVGEAFERATAVKLESGVLIVETASAQWAREIKRSQHIILSRLQSMLGDDAVRSIAVRSL
jgi:predicted nucleic acid-binding Zn ribbon protein